MNLTPRLVESVLSALASLLYDERLRARQEQRLQPGDEDSMATRDREWPGYTQWYCCPSCNRLWTHQGKDVVTLDPKFALGPAKPSEGVPGQSCMVCQGEQAVSVAEI